MLGCSRGKLRDAQPLRVEITEVEHWALAAKFGKNVVKVTNAVHEAVATSIDHGTEELSLPVPPTIRVPSRCVLDHDKRLRCGFHWTALPREGFTNNLTPEVLPDVETSVTKETR